MPRDGNEIGQPETVVRRKRANDRTTPSGEAPASANTTDEIESVGTPARRKRASLAPTPSGRPPASAPIGPASNGEAGGEGQSPRDTQPAVALAALTTELVSLQRRRKFCITQQSRSERSIESLIASMMGFRLDAGEKDRKKLFAAARAHRLAVEKGGEGHSRSDTPRSSALSAISPLILTAAVNRRPWDTLRKTAEADMRRLAESLPVYPFAKSVKGFGDLALAVVVAEAGIPLGDYRTVSGLWKRLGLAVIAGRRQQRMRDKAAAELHGYSPRRRAEVWTFCSDSMFRHQWARDKDEAGGDPKKSGNPIAVPAHPTGPYGEVYARRRTHTEPRVAATDDLPATDAAKWTKGRCHNDARRIMTKALLRDLWRAWRGLPPRGSSASE